MDANDRLLTLEETSEITRIPVSTLRFYRHKGQGGPPSFRLGARVVFARSEVLAWIEEQRATERAAV